MAFNLVTVANYTFPASTFICAYAEYVNTIIETVTSGNTATNTGASIFTGTTPPPANNMGNFTPPSTYGTTSPLNGNPAYTVQGSISDTHGSSVVSSSTVTTTTSVGAQYTVMVVLSTGSFRTKCADGAAVSALIDSIYTQIHPILN